MRLAAIAFVATFAFCSVCLAQTEEQQAAIEYAERVGRDLFEHDQAAWLGTDALRADMGDGVGAVLKGWITERQDDSVIVTFVRLSDDQPRAVYRAVLVGGALSERGPTNAPLTPYQASLYRARQAAMQSEFAACSRNYNTVTLPGDGGETADVYLLPGTTDPGLVLVGGAHRLRVNLDTMEIIERQAFSRSCLSLERDRGTHALVFTHITTPTPTETHVFLNLSLGLPLFVGTEQGIWGIENGRIRFVQESRQ